ncbi:MAG TPA: hypothetical protein VEV39_04155 [Gemmatimonadales bacterium]|nr:hypothetical protein [Gemmatimonadales bacterium]
MVDNDLIRALEHEGDRLSKSGDSLGAVNANRVAGTLRCELKEYQDAVNEVARCTKRANCTAATTEDSIALWFAEAARQERWASVVATRAHGNRVLQRRDRALPY